MDALSAALSSVRMTGAIFADAICSAPWGFAVPAIDALERSFTCSLLEPSEWWATIWSPRGRRWSGLEASEDVALTGGNIVMIPHGDPHRVTNGTPSKLIDTSPALAKWLAGDVSSMELGGGGERTHFVCGYFGCERHAARLFLAGLPSLIKINLRTDAAGRWLENSIRHLLDEAKSRRPGGAVVLSKMAEAFFIETLRRYMQQLPLEQRGWLAGARDPVVGAALALFIDSLATPGPYPSWLPRSAPRDLSSLNALCCSSASPRSPTSCAGGCSSPQGFADDTENHSASGRRCRVRAGSRLQPRLQARVRPAARAVSAEARAKRR